MSPAAWGAGRIVTPLTVLLLSGCPQQAPDGSQTTATGGPQDTADPPIPSSICESVDPSEGIDGTAGADELCPQATGDAIRIDWYPDVIIKRRSRGSVFFNAENLLREEVEVEYEATARMVGSDESFALRLPQPRRAFAPWGGGVTELDLQLGVTLDVLTQGEVEVVVAARLLRPTSTPLIVMSSVVVSTKLDDDGYIYDIDYVDW